jgi:hypothetical protein
MSHDYRDCLLCRGTYAFYATMPEFDRLTYICIHYLSTYTPKLIGRGGDGNAQSEAGNGLL